MKIVKSNSKLTPYSPFKLVMDDFFNRPSIFDEVFENEVASAGVGADVWEEENKYYIKMALPGMSKEDVSITTTDNSITIKANKKDEEKNEGKKKYYYKTLTSSYEQTFNLPSKIDAESSDARYEDGVLNLTIAKAENQKSKSIEIK